MLPYYLVNLFLSFFFPLISKTQPNHWTVFLVDRVFPRSRKKGPLTYGPICGEKWSRTHVHRSHGPMRGEKWHQQLSKYRHLSTDLSTRSRSISTVDADSLTREYGRYRRSMPIHLRRITVDRRLKIDIILWSIIDHNIFDSKDMLWRQYLSLRQKSPFQNSAA